MWKNTRLANCHHQDHQLSWSQRFQKVLLRNQKGRCANDQKHWFVTYVVVNMEQGVSRSISRPAKRNGRLNKRTVHQKLNIDHVLRHLQAFKTWFGWLKERNRRTHTINHRIKCSIWMMIYVIWWIQRSKEKMTKPTLILWKEGTSRTPRSRGWATPSMPITNRRIPIGMTIF